jgi:mono/diheme cytochrome c family protein
MARGLSFALCSLLSVAAVSLMAQQSRTVWDGVYSKRGRELYTAKCLSCHGTDLSGGEMAPPLVGIGFQSNWNGQTAGDLSERIRVSMPLGAEGTLSRQQVSDIIAAIFAAGEYPAGANELPKESDVLKTILIAPRK